MSLAAALAAASHHSAQQYGAPRGQKPATKASEGEVRERPTGTGATSPGDAASTAVGGAAAGGVAAAHRGAEDRAHALRADPRRSCAAEGGTAGGFLQEFEHRGARAGHRSAQDPTRYYPSALCGSRSTDCGTVGGSADRPDSHAHADRGADR